MKRAVVVVVVVVVGVECCWRVVKLLMKSLVVGLEQGAGDFL